ncbi:ribonuclease H-like domain-containing protein [Candidatus Woesearchaeota archaeon]|nr:ribonuclease H-like domain-containing protein [Candidatus Woesearchaeota archaeon]
MVEKIQFYPLDVTYKVIDGKPVIHLFGRTTDNKQILILDDSFEPYFYVVPKKGVDVREKLEKIEVERDDKTAKVTRTEAVNKKFLGNDVQAIKVYTQLPGDVPMIREVVKDWEILEGIYEYDIMFSRRYLIDRKIVPLTLYEAEAEHYTLRAKVPVFKALKIEQLGTETIKPRILSFDIETYSPSRSIEPEKNPIIMLAFYSGNSAKAKSQKDEKPFKKVFVWKKFKTELDFVEFVNSEAELIEKFKETIETFKPDILTGYFSDGFDLPYIKTRAEKYKISMDLGLDYSELRVNKQKVTTSRIRGITHLDIFKFIKRVMGPTMKTDAFNLDAVAGELLGGSKHDVDLDELSEIWDKHPEKLEKFCNYNLNDSLLTYKLTQKMMPTIIELVKIVGLTIYDVNRMGFSQLVEWFLLKQTPNFDEIAPNKPGYNEIQNRRLQTYKGGFVYEPHPGLYKNIVVFDYRSLYPTIIGSHNIGIGTLNCECCEGTAKKTPAEDEEYWFCTKRKGFIPTLIEELITRRMRIKEIIKSEDAKYALLDARQNSLKLLANSFYGYLGFFGARWYSLECAKATTAWGRFYIQDVIKKAEDGGFKVLYSDTDSVFLTLDGKTKEDVNKFAEKINTELPGLMELEYEGLYPAGIFVSAKMGVLGAKKKYALLSEDGTLKIKGFEAVRRNWSFIAKETQEKVLDIILRDGDKKKALKYVKKIINDLREKRIPVEKVVIHTQLQKEISDYTSKGPHVAVAQRMINRGIKIGPGALIKFVVTQGSDIIRNRAKLPDEVTEEDYDSDYYVNNQVVPALDKIFEVLGYSKDDLLEHKEQKKLEGFF